jgi:rod shape-determining protein MreC
MFRRQHYIALILVVLVAVAFLRMPSQTASKFKLAISGLFLPLFGLATSSHDLLDKTANVLLPRNELLRQNQQLRRENQELHIRLQQAEETARENNRLNQQLGRLKQARWNLKLGRIIGRDPANWWNSAQIDLGSRDGVRPNMSVLTPDGLVGRIQSVGETRSQMILLGDPNLRVAALVEATREVGIVLSSSSSPQENNMVDLGFLSGNSQVKPGHVIVTSDEGGISPKGIVIGRIVDCRTKDFGLSTEARVKLAANLSTLEEVWVVLSEGTEISPAAKYVLPHPVPTTPRANPNPQRSAPKRK